MQPPLIIFDSIPFKCPSMSWTRISKVSRNASLPYLLKQDIGVLGMKSLGFGRILDSKTVTAVECLHYAMNLPTSVVIAGWIRSPSCSKPSTPPAVSAR